MPDSLEPEQYARLKAEAKAPYKGLRNFAYLGFGASAFIGAGIFLLQLLAGTAQAETLPNFMLQLGVLALMVGLFRYENRTS
ncbi:MAG: DUF3493 domain-containing protein [Spirulina sp. SIO3F2]|nr:DUF3493 domain-containing protein [Spirulina sp. SIO3F2]